MSQPDDALDRAFSRLCLAMISLAKRDLRKYGYRASAHVFFYGDDSTFPLFRDYLRIEYPAVRMDCRFLNKGDHDG